MSTVYEKYEKVTKRLSKNIKSIVGNDLKFIENPVINYTIIAVLIAIAGLVMPNLSVDNLSVFDNIFFKTFFLILIGVVALEDPIISLLLAIIFIIAIQKLHNKKINSLNNQLLNELIDKKDISQNEDDDNYLDINNKINTNVADIVESIDTRSVPIHSPNDMDTLENVVNEYTSFTNDRQFINAQSNVIPDTSYMSQIKTFENQFGTQGLEDEVQGYTDNGLENKFSSF